MLRDRHDARRLLQTLSSKLQRPSVIQRESGRILLPEQEWDHVINVCNDLSSLANRNRREFGGVKYLNFIPSQGVRQRPPVEYPLQPRRFSDHRNAPHRYFAVPEV